MSSAREREREALEVLGPCWIWLGARNKAGYGLINKRRVHREVWEALNGPIPDGMLLHHRCHQKPCYNPLHLELKTASAHMFLHSTGLRRVPFENTVRRDDGTIIEPLKTAIEKPTAKHLRDRRYEAKHRARRAVGRRLCDSKRYAADPERQRAKKRTERARALQRERRRFLAKNDPSYRERETAKRRARRAAAIEALQEKP